MIMECTDVSHVMSVRQTFALMYMHSACFKIENDKLFQLID